MIARKSAPLPGECLRQYSRGIGTLEFIVILPFLFFITLTAIETSRMVLAYNTVVQASREAARVGAASDPFSPTGIANATAAACVVLQNGKLVSSCPAASGTISVQCVAPGACDVNTKDGSQVQATVQVNFQTIFPAFVPPSLMSITLSNQTNMAYQYLWTP